MKYFILILILISSCTSITSRKSDNILFTKKYKLNDELKNKKIAFIYFDTNDLLIDGYHHEGTHQVKQYGIFGISEEQKFKLYGNLTKIAIFSIILELKRNGLDITTFENINQVKQNNFDFIITGKIKKILLNTYGRGFHGVGSAGNYWESEVNFSDVIIRNKNNKYKLKKSVYYAKLEPSPIEYDMSCLDLLSIAAKGASKYSIKKFPEYFSKYSLKTVSFMVEIINKPLPFKIYSSVDFFINYIDDVKKDVKKLNNEIQSDTSLDIEVKYKFKKFIYSPTEIASRKAAIDIIQLIEK